MSDRILASDKVLARLQKLHPKKIDLSLDRMTSLLARLGNPETKLPPTVHVAGTNGKGSTIAFLRAICEAADLRVHVYTSPHLVRFAERIRLGGQLIDEDRLLRLLKECEKINGHSPITYFEITTAIALKAFAENPADILLLEVGLGGRLDATNIIEQPLSTIITPVSLDHQQFLGTDLAGIAREKAGIAKRNTPLIIALQEEIAQNAIRDHARIVGAKIIEGWTVKETGNGFIYEDQQGRLSLPRPALPGPHQIANAALAIACLRHQAKIHVTGEHIISGLANVSWPARLQDITDCPYGQILPDGSALWLDGGHNPAAGQILAEFFSGSDPRPLTVICAMMAGKDTEKFLAPLVPHVTRLYGVEIRGEDSHSAQEMKEIAHKSGMNAESSNSVIDALHALSDNKAVRVLICGSLYLAGQVLDANNLLPD